MRGDAIFVQKLALRAVAGLDAWRRPQTQTFLCSFKVGAGSRLKKLGLSDDLDQSLNYDEISQTLRARAESTPYKSPQNLATSLFDLLKLKSWQGHAVELTLTQPKAFLRHASLDMSLRTDQPQVHSAISGLNVHTTIGINPLERVHRQDVIIDIDLGATEMGSNQLADLVSAVTVYAEDKAQWETVESFANAVAELLLTKYKLPFVGVSARKPSALNLAEAAGVAVERTPADELGPASSVNGGSLEKVVYLAFGSNLGDRAQNIRQSVQELASRGITVLATSQLYESEPAFFLEQPRYLNGVFKCSTNLAPLEILAAVKDIEYGAFSRVKHHDNCARTLDLDILFWGSETFESPELSIPHIGLRERAFVLRPLSDVCELHPVTGEPIATILSGVDQSELVPVIPLPSLPGGVLRRDHTAMMAIMNATPDSFSDGGKLNVDNAMRLAEAHIAAGSSILDVGGLSTRPGSSTCSAEEEIERVVPVITKLRSFGVPISIDTYRADVAREALSAGAEMINDVFSGALDAQIWSVAQETGVAFVASHARGTPETMATLASYEDVVDDVARELAATKDVALVHGIAAWQLVLDPGLGFAKNAEDDLALVRDFARLRDDPRLRGHAWLVGPSRKRFVGHFTGEKVPHERGPGTSAVATALAAASCDIVRVHDTAAVGQTLKMANALYRT